MRKIDILQSTTHIKTSLYILSNEAICVFRFSIHFVRKTHVFKAQSFITPYTLDFSKKKRVELTISNLQLSFVQYNFITIQPGSHCSCRLKSVDCK